MVRWRRPGPCQAQSRRFVRGARFKLERSRSARITRSPYRSAGRPLEHFLIYGVFGWCAEILWTACHDFITGYRVDPADPSVRVPLSPPERWRLTGQTYLWMFPLYGAGGLLFEPIHNALRHHPWPLRGLVWMVLIFLIEYLSGWLLRRLTGRCPWDYACVSTNIHGLVRLDYAPVWFIFGLLLEHLHDTLSGAV